MPLFFSVNPENKLETSANPETINGAEGPIRGRSPRTLGGFGGMLPRKNFEKLDSIGAFRGVFELSRKKKELYSLAYFINKFTK